jgi:hypothetical protein
MRYFIVTYTGIPIGQSGEGFGTEYDFSHACEICGTGARFKPPLIVKGLNTKVKSQLFRTRNSDWIISSDLAQKLIDFGLSFETCSISEFQRGTLDSHLAVCPMHSLPKALDTSTGFEIEGQCDNCRRDGYFNKISIPLSLGEKSHLHPLVLKYDQQELNRVPVEDIYSTWEHFGNSNKVASGNKVVHFARPLLIISEQFKLILEDGGIGGLRFEQVLVS